MNKNKLKQIEEKQNKNRAELRGNRRVRQEDEEENTAQIFDGEASLFPYEFDHNN